MRAFGILILLLIVGKSHAQLNFNTQARLTIGKDAVANFITSSNFDYALIAWPGWSGLRKNQFSSIVRQNNTWYIVRFESPAFLDVDAPRVSALKQILLQQDQADSLFAIMKPDSAFLYSQEELDKLPENCPIIKDGIKYIVDTVDAGGYNLIEYSNSRFRTIKRYDPGFYLSECYPLTPAYGKLKGLVNTYENLTKAIDGINK